MIIHQLYSDIAQVYNYQEKWKERIVLEWNESKKFPRKKKKRIRKELLLDWQIANFDVLGRL